MAKVLKINKKVHRTDLYDSNTGKKCLPEKVVDVTKNCFFLKEGEKVIFIYTRDIKHGRIIQIRFLHEGDEFSNAVHIHFYVDELEFEVKATPMVSSFGLRAERLGLSPSQLRTLIEKYAPKRK
jgi:hypothetical protein